MFVGVLGRDKPICAVEPFVLGGAGVFLGISFRGGCDFDEGGLAVEFEEEVDDSRTGGKAS